MFQYSVPLTKYYSVDQIKNNWMDGARGTYGEQGRFVLRCGRERGTWEDIGIDGRVILKNLKKWGGPRLV